MPFELTRREISDVPSDAVIIDGAGEMGVTKGGISGRYEIVSPVERWSGDIAPVVSAYLAALEEASGRRCGRVAMSPLGILAGTPPQEAVRAGVRAASIFLNDHDMDVILSVPESLVPRFDDYFYAYLREYINRRYSGSDGGGIFNRSFYRTPPRPPAITAMPQLCAAPTAAPASLEEMLKSTDAGFSQTLLKLIDESGRKDSEVYKKANIDRKLFSKIRANPGYRPSKSTALALALALELDIGATRDLISRAGYSLTHASRRDIIVEYFILSGNYDIFEINETLFAFDQPLLGGGSGA